MAGCPVRGVLEGDRLRRAHADAVERGQVDVRRRLGLPDVVAAADRVEGLQCANALQVALDPAARRRRRHRQQHSCIDRRVDQIRHARARSKARVGGVFADAHLFQDRREVHAGTDEPLQVVVRIEDGAHAALPELRREDMAVAAIRLLDRRQRGRLGVDDQAVEVEDQRAQAHRISPRILTGAGARTKRGRDR
ncbi:MAG: hypothetical protein OXC31_17440 [Spirochaetaceae bacterium]|nr:hypothetical protein [Spirochaetaceae bacterium]